MAKNQQGKHGHPYPIHETILLWLPLGTWGERNKIRTILTVNSWIINWELQRTNKVVGCEPFVLSCVISRFSQQSQPPIEFVDVTSPPSHFRRKNKIFQATLGPTQKLQWWELAFTRQILNISHVYSTNVCKTWYWTNIITTKHLQNTSNNSKSLQGHRSSLEFIEAKAGLCSKACGSTFSTCCNGSLAQMSEGPACFLAGEKSRDDWWWLKMCWFCCWNGLLNNFDETKICL